MKNYNPVFTFLFVVFFCACAEKSPKEVSTKSSSEVEFTTIDNDTILLSNELQESLKLLSGFLNDDKENESHTNKTPETVALEKLLELSEANSNGEGNSSSLLTILNSTMFLDLLEASGVSREEMLRLINNPDSLQILAQEAIKNRKAEKQQEETYKNKGKLSNEQLVSKNTPTGISLEEAILLVQAESGMEATMEKLKKIDAMAGTNVMTQMDLSEAGYVFQDIERKNEEPANAEEKAKIEKLRKKSGQMHSVKETTALLTELDNAEKDIASGKLKVSPTYQRAIAHQKKTAKIFHNDIVRKSKAAKEKFKRLNPDLYFGEKVGETYMGHMKKAVYLPLGKLSFADKVVAVKHPKQMVQQVNNVLGEPDVIEGFLAEDITGIHSLGLGGNLTVQFEDNALTDVNGPDLYIFEIGRIEPTDLEISKDGKNWIKVGKIDGGVAEVDIAPYVKKGELFYYVQLKDLKQVSALPGADVDAIAAIGAAMRLNLDSKVLFETGKSQLKTEGISALKVLAKSIAVLIKGNVIVEGHTDDVGSDQTNQALSLARAKSVSAALKKLIPSAGFKWKEIGFGESKPLVENDSDANRAKNRRVEILIIPN